MCFGESLDIDDIEHCSRHIKSYLVEAEVPLNSKYLGLQRLSNVNNWQRTRFIVPRFRRNKIRKIFYISEFAVMSQLTYGNQLNYYYYNCQFSD